MNDQELKDLWRKQRTEPAPPVDALAQIEAMRKKMSELHATLNARNVGELAACGFVIVVFSVYFFIFPYPVARIGDLIIIGGSLFASWKFIETRRRAPRPDAAAPMVHWLKQERERVHHEAELLRTVLWWYILPIGLGTNVFLWGLPNVPLAGKIGFTGMATLMYVWIYWLNQSARRKRLLPVQDELEALLQQESQAGTAEENPSSTQTRKRSNTAWMVLAFLIAFFSVLAGAWNSFKDSRAESPPLAPGLDDVSAFSGGDIARV